MATVVASLAACALLAPSACSGVQECAAAHEQVATHFNGYAAYGLGMVLVGELATLISTYTGAAETQSMLPDLQSRCMPSIFLVVCFLAQICEDSVFVASTSPWFASARPDLQGPAYTVTFVQWLAIAPLFFAMAGHCALGRPLRDLGWPVVATNVCIVLAWMALLTSGTVVRWSLVAAASLLYAFTCLNIVFWVVDYAHHAPPGLPSRWLRPCLSLGLIAALAAYSSVYILVLVGVMPPRMERSVVLFLNVGTKLAFSAVFAVMRGNEYHLVLVGGLRTLSTSNVALMSILRGSFDILLPCVGEAEGACRLPPANAGDMAHFEHSLLRPVAGLTFGDLLADDCERARFAAYVRNAQLQSEQGKSLTDIARAEWTPDVLSKMPPVAQILNCRLAMGPIPAPAGVRPMTLGCSVHLSVVPSSASACGKGAPRMVAAVRFTESSALARPAEAMPVPGFEAFEPSGTSTLEAPSGQGERDTHVECAKPEGGLLASVLEVAKFFALMLLHSATGAPIEGKSCFAFGDGNLGSPAFLDIPEPLQHLPPQQQLRLPRQPRQLPQRRPSQRGAAGAAEHEGRLAQARRGLAPLAPVGAQGAATPQNSEPASPSIFSHFSGGSTLSHLSRRGTWQHWSRSTTETEETRSTAEAVRQGEGQQLARPPAAAAATAEAAARHAAAVAAAIAEAVVPAAGAAAATAATAAPTEAAAATQPAAAVARAAGQAAAGAATLALAAEEAAAAPAALVALVAGESTATLAAARALAAGEAAAAPAAAAAPVAGEAPEGLDAGAQSQSECAAVGASREVAPTQVGFAVSTVGLAAAVSLLSSRRHI